MTDCTKKAALSQYPKHYAHTLPYELGRMFSILSEMGIDVHDIDTLLGSSKLMDLLMYGDNYALANSGHRTLFAFLLALDRNSDNCLSDITEEKYIAKMSEKRIDWLTLWSVETVIDIAKWEGVALSEVLAICPFDFVKRVSPKWHTFPPSAFYDEVYLKIKKDAFMRRRDRNAVS